MTAVQKQMRRGAPSPPPEALRDDHRFAAWAAEAAGSVLLDLRGSGLLGREL